MNQKNPTDNSIKSHILDSSVEQDGAYNQSYEYQNRKKIFFTLGRLNGGGTKSKKEFRGVSMKSRDINSNGGRISFDTKKKNKTGSRGYMKHQQFHPNEKQQNNYTDESLGEESVNHVDSFSKHNKINQYYHNAKALENVLKEDKEVLQKREKDKLALLERKQKVASYSKLVKEIHWEGNTQHKDKLEYLAKKKKNLVQNSQNNNNTFEDGKPSRMAAVDKVKNLRRRQTDRQKRSVQEQGEMTLNHDDSIDNKYTRLNHNKSQNKPIRKLGEYENYQAEVDFPKSSKHKADHNFIGENNSKF